MHGSSKSLYVCIIPFLMLTRCIWFLLNHPCPHAGGTFALYSLLCRHAKINTIPNQHRTDEELTTYSRTTFHEHSYAAKTKRWLEGHASRKNMLLILVLVGTCMLIGDGILTPAISGMPFFILEPFIASLFIYLSAFPSTIKYRCICLSYIGCMYECVKPDY